MSALSPVLAHAPMESAQDRRIASWTEAFDRPAKVGDL